MDKDELYEIIQDLYNEYGDWDELSLLNFTKLINLKFKTYLEENQPDYYDEFLENFKMQNEKDLLEQDMFVTFTKCMEDYTEEEILEIFVDFILQDEDLLEEVMENINAFKEKKKEEDESYYSEEYDDLKEDRYDDYDDDDWDSYN